MTKHKRHFKSGSGNSANTQSLRSTPFGRSACLGRRDDRNIADRPVRDACSSEKFDGARLYTPFHLVIHRSIHVIHRSIHRLRCETTSSGVSFGDGRLHLVVTATLHACLRGPSFPINRTCLIRDAIADRIANYTSNLCSGIAHTTRSGDDRWIGHPSLHAAVCVPLPT